MQIQLFTDLAQKGQRYYAVTQEKKSLINLLNNSQKLNIVQGGMA
ncbi:hypothetical protein NIES2111_66330 (plasmid) [Nostoc sp. NIES-2111]|nr:hypothetical protein NIES2111_66330 [Nostoc sp. NIES-2111]